MPSARQPAAAPRDRAERHVFAILPELSAVQRRVLALLELCSLSVAETAGDLGIEEEAVQAAAFAARRSLRRERVALAAGSRCTRAERLHSDRLDVALERLDRKWLEIHEARCPRCEEHASLLDEARTELRVTYAAPDEKQLPPPPEPPALDAGEPPRAQLRVVPPEQAAPEEPAAPTPPAPPAPVQDIEWTVEPQYAADVSTRRRSLAPSPATKRAARVVAIVLAIAALLAAAGYGLAQLGGSDHQSAPWAQPHAPNVRPAPLSGQ